ncbi:helix-turn-helix domain-containing protein [Paenibacillus mesophilus]|uniref:AraC family transcriptional regulator n=1 Tax=Paenibacillus mesophilus TaxID=2582849 RepID=UPI00110F536C|nr:helix-turn-helix domain-containing protein [Paenibacillus mesophilus]TMV48766.1 helix-turn-helix domain-containing protein [Paenibacillus mesophilus]
MLFADTLRRPIELQLVVERAAPYKEVFHFHPGVEIFYIHEGVGQVIVEQQMHEVKSGTLLFFRPFQPHYQQMEVGPAQPYVRSLIKYNPTYFSEFLKPFPSLYKFHDYLCHSDSVLQIQHRLAPEQLDRLIRDFNLRFKSRPVIDDLERNALFLLSFFHFIQPLWQSYKEAEVQKTMTDPFVVRILKWIDEYYQEEFQLEALAHVVHLSPNHTSYLFQKTTGKTITDFLTIRRMKQASMLLQTTALSIQEVGERSGYPNFSYFCQAFKKHMGMTPGQFRSQPPMLE